MWKDKRCWPAFPLKFPLDAHHESTRERGQSPWLSHALTWGYLQPVNERSNNDSTLRSRGAAPAALKMRLGAEPNRSVAKFGSLGSGSVHCQWFALTLRALCWGPWSEPRFSLTRCTKAVCSLVSSLWRPERRIASHLLDFLLWK